MTGEEIIEERDARYGEWAEQATISQRLKRIVGNTPNWSTLEDFQKESIEMCLHKLSRILNGDPDYKDSWEDASLYLKLVVDRL